MIKSPFLIFFLMLFFAGGMLYANGNTEDLICDEIITKAPPMFVVPTGYSTKDDKDAPKNFNYTAGETKVENDTVDTANSNRFIVPKRSIVRVSAAYKEAIENDKKYGKTWVPVQVISLPPENESLQKSNTKTHQTVAKIQNTSGVKEATIGSVGYLKVADLEKVEKQQDYVFIVKRDSELFTQLNQNLNANGYKALEPYALRLKETANGYAVNQCCYPNSNKCITYPIFEILNVTDQNGNNVEHFEEVKCEKCFYNFANSITPIEDQFLDPIRSILSHPSLGLPEQANDLRKISSISKIEFVDSRGFVKIPVIEKDKGVAGPFNSLHYGAESGDADVYMKPDVACGFMQFLKEWDKTCKGKDSCQIEFGDASHAFHKNCTKKIVMKDGKPVIVDGKPLKACANPWPHESHTSGECIDINTSRMSDDKLAPMVRLLQQLGNENCFSNEPKLKKVGCKGLEGHNTHMHMCFPSNVTATSKSIPNPKLKKACEQGVSQ